MSIVEQWTDARYAVPVSFQVLYPDAGPVVFVAPPEPAIARHVSTVDSSYDFVVTLDADREVSVDEWSLSRADFRTWLTECLDLLDRTEPAHLQTGMSG